MEEAKSSIAPLEPTVKVGEDKEARKEFLTLKLADLQERIKTIKQELKEL